MIVCDGRQFRDFIRVIAFLKKYYLYNVSQLSSTSVKFKGLTQIGNIVTTNNEMVPNCDETYGENDNYYLGFDAPGGNCDGTQSNTGATTKLEDDLNALINQRNRFLYFL